MSALLLGLYFAVWALLHSVLASLRAKRLAEELFGSAARRWYRLAFIAVAAVTVTPLLGLYFLLPDRGVYSVPSPWRWLMAAGQVAGLAVLLWTAAAADPQGSAGLRRLRPRRVGGTRRPGTAPRRKAGPFAGGRPPVLKTAGLYALVRHPMYLAGIVVMWLTPRMTVDRLVLFALATAYLWMGSFHEERLLEHKFGQPYRDYRRRVPRLIPGLRPGRRSSRS